MPKVREVLAKIGDGPLTEVLRDRGYVVAHMLGKHGVALPDETKDMADEMADRGYVVMKEEEAEVSDWDHAFELLRNNRIDELRQWLRDEIHHYTGRIA